MEPGVGELLLDPVAPERGVVPAPPGGPRVCRARWRGGAAGGAAAGAGPGSARRRRRPWAMRVARYAQNRGSPVEAAAMAAAAAAAALLAAATEAGGAAAAAVGRMVRPAPVAAAFVSAAVAAVALGRVERAERILLETDSGSGHVCRGGALRVGAGLGLGVI